MEVKPLQTLLILIFFGGLLGLVMWSGMEARLVQGPSDLRVDGLDRLHIRIHDKVFVYDAWFDLLDEYALVESDWDVLAKQQDLHSGAIDRNDARSLYLAHTSLPAGSEPPPMAEFGGDMVVADYAGMAVHRYLPSGEYLGLVSSGSQAAYISALETRRRRFFALEYAVWGVFALALIAGLVVAIRAEIRKAKSSDAVQTLARAAVAPTTARPHHLDPDIHWLEPKKTLLWLMLSMVVLVALLPLLPLVAALQIPRADDAAAQCSEMAIRLLVWGAMGLFLLILVPALLLVRRLLRTRIGVLHEWVLADRGNGTVRIARDEQLLRLSRGFIIEGVTIPTGSPQLGFYPKKELEEWLNPRLDRATAMNPLRQLLWQWQNKRGLFMAALVALLCLGALVVAVEQDGVKQGLKQWLQNRPECQVGEIRLNNNHRSGDKR